MPTLNDVNHKKCPYCNSKNSLINYGHYKRNISFVSNNQLVNFYVSIQRVQCTGCKKTHALLPCFVIPYVIMASNSIAKIVADSIKSSAYKMSDLMSISYQIIYKYISMVLAFYLDFFILNNKKEFVSASIFTKKYFLANCEKFSNYYYKLEFFDFYNWPLFMQKFRNNCSPPVSVFISKSPPT